MAKSEQSKIEKPKVSARILVRNTWFIIKLIFKADPLGATICVLERARNSIQLFFEHTLLISYVLECIEFGRPFKEAAIAIGIMVLVIAFSTILGSYAWQKLWPQTVLKAKTRLKDMIFEKAQQVDLEQFDNPEYYNDFVLTVGKVDMIIDRGWGIIWLWSGAIIGLLTTGAFFIGQSYLAFFIVLIAAAIRMFFYFKRNALWYRREIETQPKYRRTEYTKRLFYLMDYAKEIRLNPDVKDDAFESYDKSYDGLIGILKKYNKKIVGMSLLSATLSQAIIDVVMVLFLVYQASVLGVISYSMVVVLINASNRLRGDMDQMVFGIADSAEACMYIEKVREFLNKKGKITSQKQLPVSEGPKQLELRNVSFRYTETSEDILKNVSLTINAREKVALVGYNGAGKTTLIKLIMRLYDPTEGVILCDGVDIRDYEVESYRKHIGVIFQDFNIYAASVRENVVMDICDESADDGVKNALRSSGFTERLETLEGGVQTELTTEFDEKGINLSGGESQKVAVARAFYNKTGLIILDEPSSALDPIAEYNLNHYMLEAARESTVVFISHRLSTTRIADRIYMLEDGRIIESGSHRQLLELDGKYAEMWRAQASQYSSAE